MFRFVMRAFIALATIATLAVAVSPAQAAAPVVEAPPPVFVAPTPRLVDVDVQEFRRFDRLVLRFRNGTPDVRARYVRFALDQDGDVVNLPGRRLLVVRLQPARARSLDQSVQNFAGDNVRAVRLIEDRRGVVRLAVGVRQAQRVRVIELPNRILIDVPHRNRVLS